MSTQALGLQPIEPFLLCQDIIILADPTVYIDHFTWVE
jgi:hypothetical protein